MNSIFYLALYLTNLTSQKQDLKNTDFVDMMIPQFFMIYPSTKISH